MLDSFVHSNVRIKKGVEFASRELIGKTYGSHLAVEQKGKLRPLSVHEANDVHALFGLDASAAGTDNRDMMLDQSAQALGADDIAQRKAEGVDGYAFCVAYTVVLRISVPRVRARPPRAPRGAFAA